jgi:acyl dehydratase
LDQTFEAPKTLYLEDLHVGQRFTSGQYQMDADRIKEFAQEFDPQAFHLDEEAGRRSVFDGLAASGWHTAAATMRLLVTGGLPFDFCTSPATSYRPRVPPARVSLCR